MKKLVAICLLFASLSSTVEARTRTGAVTMRGIAAGVSGQGFSLHTRTHGTIVVQIRPQTRIVSKGHSGTLTLHSDDHVGVRGILSGLSMVAITIRIYSVKAKPFSIHGTVWAVGQTTISIKAGSKLVTGRLTSSTVTNVGIGTSVLRHIRPGEKVLARMIGSGTATVIALHVYIPRVSAHSVSVSGVVTAASHTSVSVKTASGMTRVALDGSTSFVMGGIHVAASALHTNMRVSVHACCVGRPLVATSIHISKPTLPHSVVLHGSVRRVAPGKLVVQVGSRTIDIAVPQTARITIGAVSSAISSVHVNDHISIRAVAAGLGYVASSVHVPARTQHSRAVVGVITSTGRSSVTVTTRSGRHWEVTSNRGTRVQLAGKATTLGALHQGDGVHVRGRAVGSTGVLAATVTATLAPLKNVTVRGTLATYAVGVMTLLTASGSRVTVRFASGVHPTLHGVTAPSSSLFVGVRVTVHGTMRGSGVLASQVAIEVISRHVAGRVQHNSGSGLSIQRGSHSLVQVDLPSGLQATDTGHRLAATSIRPGAFVSVDGFEITVAHMRAAAVQLQHPAISKPVTVIQSGVVPTVRTAAGQAYAVHVQGGASVLITRYALPVRLADVPVGTKLHVTGTVQTDGSVMASSITVSLRSSILRGVVAAVGPPLVVRTTGGTLAVRLAAASRVVQGSRPSALNRIVVGDDISLHGYVLSGGVILTRTLDLHRKLTALDGSVSSLTADGFLLDVGGQPVKILLFLSTSVTGREPSVSPGFAVHVSGYLRGDGVVEATHVRIGKHQP